MDGLEVFDLSILRNSMDVHQATADYLLPSPSLTYGLRMILQHIASIRPLPARQRLPGRGDGGLNRMMQATAHGQAMDTALNVLPTFAKPSGRE